MERCKHCMGVGLIKKDRIDLQLKICECNQKQSCYLCENASQLGIYKECGICFGDGEMPTLKITESHNKITIVNKNE